MEAAATLPPTPFTDLPAADLATTTSVVDIKPAASAQQQLQQTTSRASYNFDILLIPAPTDECELKNAEPLINDDDTDEALFNRDPTRKMPRIYYVCTHCPISFSTRKLFEAHIVRRHADCRCPARWPLLYDDDDEEEEEEPAPQPPLPPPPPAPRPFPIQLAKSTRPSIPDPAAAAAADSINETTLSDDEADTDYRQTTPSSSRRKKRHRNKSTPANASGSGYMCSECGKGPWKSGFDLRRHQLTHTGERPFGCPKCNGWFRQNAALLTHLSRVHNAKPFICHANGCKRAYQSASERAEHCEQTGHNWRKGGTSEHSLQQQMAPPLSLPEMTTMTTAIGDGARKRARKKKRRAGTGASGGGESERILECLRCREAMKSAEFRSRDTARIHVCLEHADWLPFCCDACGQRFRRRSSLAHHVYTATHEVIFVV